VLVPGLIAALTLGLAPAEASGAGEAIELHWTAPVGCPEHAEARALVERLVPSSKASLRAEARIEAVAGGFAGMLELRPADRSDGVRRLRADDCTVLARAMAVVIAVSLDPVAVAESERATAVPDPAPMRERPDAERMEPRRAQTPSDAENPADADTRSSAADRPLAEPRPTRGGLEGGLRIGGGVGGLLLPAAGVGLVLAPFIGTARIHVRAVAQYWPPQRVAFAPPRDVSGELQLFTGGVRVCPQLAWDRVSLPLCAGVDGGAMLGRGTGRDLPTKHTARGPWAGAVLEPGLTVGVTSRMSLWLALEGVVSLYRPSFAVEGAPEVWTAPEGAVRGLFGVQVHARRERPQKP
jgi:hypothetical protein